MHKAVITASVLLFSLTLSTSAFAQGGPGASGQNVPGSAQPQAQQEPARTPPGQETLSGPGEFISSGKIMGQNVQTPDGQRLGQIRGLVMDMEADRIGFAVVSAGGVLGIGRRDHLVPWNALQVDPQQGTYTLNVTPEQLRDAPTVKDVTSREEAARLHEYYGVSPYWMEDETRIRPQQEPYPWEQPGGQLEERSPRTLREN